MWQSVLRIVFALLITAVGASLMVGSVSAEGPVSKEPPGGEGTPILVVPADETVRVGDAVSEDVIRQTWSAMWPETRQRLGLASIDDLRQLEIRGPVSIGGALLTGVPTPDIQVIEKTVPAPGGSDGPRAGDSALASSNACGTQKAKGHDVHHSRTKWCYDGIHVVPTPNLINMKVWGSFHWWWDGIIFMTRTGTPQDIWTVSGGYNQDHHEDKSHVIVQEQQYWVGHSDPEAVCIRFDSYIQKKQHGNGSKGSPQVTKGNKWFC